jgi:hypothetical protein
MGREEAEVELLWVSPNGRRGLDTSGRSPVARVVRRALDDGSPFRGFSLTFFDSGWHRLGERWRWFGAIQETVAGRIILYPAFLHDTILSKKGRGKTEIARFPVDHVTLERDLQKWHLSRGDSGRHIGSPRTVSVGPSLFHWLTLNVVSADELCPLFRRTVVTASVPDPDARRRVDVIMRAREGKVFNNLRAPRPLTRPRPSFLQFVLTVGPKDCSTYHAPIDDRVYESDRVMFDGELPSRIPSRTHRVGLDNVDVQIDARWLPGTMQIPALFLGAA